MNGLVHNVKDQLPRAVKLRIPEGVSILNACIDVLKVVLL